MRTKNSIFVLLLSVIFLSGCVVLSGCSLYRESLLEMSREDVKNAVAVREAADNFFLTWELNSAFIRKVLGTRIDEFPQQFSTAMDELDTMIGIPIENRTDTDRGGFLGLRVRTLESLVQEALKTFAPDVLDLIPFPLKF